MVIGMDVFLHGFGLRKSAIFVERSL